MKPAVGSIWRHRRFDWLVVVDANPYPEVVSWRKPGMLSAQHLSSWPLDFEFIAPSGPAAIWRDWWLGRITL